MVPKLKIESRSKTTVELKVATAETSPQFTHVKVMNRGEDALGWNRLYAYLWARAEIKLKDETDWENKVEIQVLKQMRELEAEFPGLHPDIMTLTDLENILLELNIEFVVSDEINQIVQRVLNSLGDRDLGAQGDYYADNFFTQARWCHESCRSEVTEIRR
jgi:hypothetical protein